MNPTIPASASRVRAARSTRTLGSLRVLALIAVMFGSCGLSALVGKPNTLPERLVRPAGFTGRPLFRKLHLIRPDLLFYPVQYEVYC